MYKRLLLLPQLRDSAKDSDKIESFFLWGTRQTGKSSLLKLLYPNALYLDLLKNDVFTKYNSSPQRLREELSYSQEKFVVIDEIQKIPALLDEVHWLIENEKVAFALCGSSARKLKRGHANLLGGRALRYELCGLSAFELGADFNLVKLLNHGYLPRHYSSSNIKEKLNAYVANYLKEEIFDEALVRKLNPFSTFLNSAALSDTEMVNYTTIARDCGVSSLTVKEYYQILFDTLLAKEVPAFTKRPKRKVISASKIYFSDVGVVNFLAKRNQLEFGSEAMGKAFENWIFHELNCYSLYNSKFADFSYWKTTSGFEVDFIVNNLEVAIEAKAVSKVSSDHLKGLREIAKDHPEMLETSKRILVCNESTPRKTEDGILIMPYNEFLKKLWGGEIL